MADVSAYWSIRRLGEAYRRGDLTPSAAAADLLERIAREDRRLHSYAYLAPDLVMAQAERLERELAGGHDRGPLHGVPIGVKDLCATIDMPTRAGMPRLDPVMPGQDATVVARLREAGAVIVGKLQMTEGATGVHHPEVTPPINPWGADLWTGISSSGSGVAPAAGLCQASLGTDTGGSIRFPASCCGLTGLKPTWGRVSRAGVFACAESMDHVGSLARSAADVAAVLAAIAGPDPADPSTGLAPAPDYAAELGEGLAGIALGVDEAFIGDDVDAEVSAAVGDAVRILASLGARPTPITFPRAGGASRTTGGFLAEIGIAHAETFPSRAEAYGPSLRGILEAAQHVSARQVVEAGRARIALRREIDVVLAATPLLVLPAMPMVTPSAAGGVEAMLDPVAQQRTTRFTTVFDLSGHPTITLPCGFDRRGAPIGVQLVGRPMAEAALLRAAYAFQQVTDFHLRRPAAGRWRVAVADR